MGGWLATRAAGAAALALLLTFAAPGLALPDDPPSYMGSATYVGGIHSASDAAYFVCVYGDPATDGVHVFHLEDGCLLLLPEGQATVTLQVKGHSGDNAVFYYNYIECPDDAERLGIGQATLTPGGCRWILVRPSAWPLWTEGTMVLT